MAIIGKMMNDHTLEDGKTLDNSSFITVADHTTK